MSWFFDRIHLAQMYRVWLYKNVNSDHLLFSTVPSIRCSCVYLRLSTSHTRCVQYLLVGSGCAAIIACLLQPLGFENSQAVIVPLFFLVSINLLFNNWAKDQVRTGQCAVGLFLRVL